MFYYVVTPTTYCGPARHQDLRSLG